MRLRLGHLVICSLIWFDEGKHHIHIPLEKQEDNPYLSTASSSDEGMLAKEIKTQSTAVATNQDNSELVSVTQTFPGSVQLFMPMKDTLPFLQSKLPAEPRSRPNFVLWMLKHLTDSAAREV